MSLVLGGKVHETFSQWHLPEMDVFKKTTAYFLSIYVVFSKDWAASYWIEQGCPGEKLILGIGMYGRSFVLADPAKHKVGDKATGPGAAGKYSREAGFLAYYEVYLLMNIMIMHVNWFK